MHQPRGKVYGKLGLSAGIDAFQAREIKLELGRGERRGMLLRPMSIALAFELPDTVG